MGVKYRREGQVAFVELDNPPVNAIGLDIRAGLMDALDRVEAEEGLSHVVLSGAGRMFAAGADAREFDAPPVEPHLPEVCVRIEASETPWVAAVTGMALGGGCELALACRYRICASDAKLGLPEVTLGVVPGSGGTQRLPRLVGLKNALEMISTGRPVDAKKAEAIGLVNGVAEDPVEIATHLDLGTIDNELLVRDMPAPALDETVADEFRALANKKMANQIAPQKAIDLVVKACGTPFDEAMAEERATFIDLRQGDQAKALRHAFFAERSAKKPDGVNADPGKLETVAVIGGGTMGAGIAYAVLLAGMSVVLLENDSDGVERANTNVEKIIEASLGRKLIDDAKAASIRERLSVSDNYQDASAADLAIEAAFESMEVKKSIFTKLEQSLSPEAILATNTSYLDVNEIAATVADPTRVVGLHFFAPAHIMKLLEIVRGDASSDKALAVAFEVGKRLRKIPVLSGVCDGFIGNRILSRYREQADIVMLEASNPWEVDEAMVAFGYAMGPYETQDLSGLDIAYANRRRQDATRDPDRRYVTIQDRMYELGKLGRKTGAGWYRYPGGGGKVDDPIVADLVIEEARFAGVERIEMSDDEIREQLLLAMINEAADILHEGIAASAKDIDLVTLFGYGFPRWRGGLMHYADTLGVENIVSKLEELNKQDPVIWKPSEALYECLRGGLTLAARYP